MSKVKLNRLFALALALVMTLSMAVPVLAATDEDGYTITIVPNAYTATPTDGGADATRFAAYQIFAGDINEKPSAEGGYNGTVGEDKDENGYRDPNANQLSNVKWGTGVKSDDIGKLLYELIQDGTVNSGNKLYTALTTAGYVVDIGTKTVKLPDENEKNLTLDDTAAIVAKVLADQNGFTTNPDGSKTPNNNAALARAFAEVVSKHLSDTATATSTWDSEKKEWNISIPKAGYYLIKDTHQNKPGETNKAKSDYLVGVFGDSKIYVKSNIPTVDKKIVGAQPPEGDSAEIGKPVTFQLFGTLPENFGAYDSYFYQFNDTLSKGLTYEGGGSAISNANYNNVLRVYVKIGTEYYLIDLDPMNGGEGNDEATGEGYQLSVAASGSDGETSLTVTFDDLKKLKGKKVTDTSTWAASDESVTLTLTATSEIYVEYKAHLNKDALINAANPNDVSLKYSNDPTWNGTGEEPTGETPKEYVYVYDFGVNLYKFDAIKGETNGKLAGAGFAVSKTVSGVKYYAIFAEENGKYVLAGWVEDSALTSLDTNGDGKWDSADWKAAATTGIEGTKLTGKLNEAYKDATTAKYYLALVTDANGNLNFKGLEDDITYTLSEVITPEGYDTLPGDITVTYTAEYYGENFATVIDNEIKDIQAEINRLTQESADENADKIRALQAQITVLENEKERALVGQLRSLTATVTGLDENQASQKIVENGQLVGTAYTEFAAKLNVPNTPAGYLPGTGGMGVYLFYIAGGILLACGVAFLLLSGRKKNVQ